jgi:Putative transposase of IS4/5 family (DUF4096)
MRTKAWALIAPMLPAARPGGRPRKINVRAVLKAIFYLLRTGCQWRLLPREFPGWSTVYHYFQAWKNAGAWTCIQRSMLMILAMLFIGVAMVASLGDYHMLPDNPSAAGHLDPDFDSPPADKSKIDEATAISANNLCAGTICSRM